MRPGVPVSTLSFDDLHAEALRLSAEMLGWMAESGEFDVFPFATINRLYLIAKGSIDEALQRRLPSDDSTDLLRSTIHLQLINAEQQLHALKEDRKQ